MIIMTCSDGVLHEVTERLAEDHDLWAKHFLAAFEKMIQNGYDQVGKSNKSIDKMIQNR